MPTFQHPTPEQRATFIIALHVKALGTKTHIKMHTSTYIDLVLVSTTHDVVVGDTQRIDTAPRTLQHSNTLQALQIPYLHGREEGGKNLEPSTHIYIISVTMGMVSTDLHSLVRT